MSAQNTAMPLLIRENPQRGREDESTDTIEMLDFRNGFITDRASSPADSSSAGDW